MLEEVSREEKSGYRAEIHSLGHPTSQYSQPREENKKEAVKKQQDDIIDTYGDDFDEEIEEDLPEDNHLLDSNDNMNHKPITESLGGVTVSQSLGVDPSVDSLALEDYDHIEPVERLHGE